MNIEEVKIDTEEIQLDQFLKWAGVLASCGETKALIAEAASSATAKSSRHAAASSTMAMS